MKIEDELRTTLKRRANSVTADDEAAWASFERRVGRKHRSARIGAALVAAVITIGALVVLAFSPSDAIRPAALVTYTSVDQIETDLHEGGINCTRRRAIPGLSMGVVDEGVCEVSGRRITISIYETADAMERHAQPPTSPSEWRGVSWVRGENWFIATKSSEVATAIQSVLGGAILGGTGDAGSVAAPSAVPANPVDLPALESVRVVDQHIVGSTPDALFVESPVGEVRWRLSSDCAVAAGPVGEKNGGWLSGGCGGGRLTTDGVGGLRVSGVFYYVLRGTADFAEGTTVRVTFVDGTTTEVRAANGLWMVIFLADPSPFSPTPHVATVRAISATGKTLDTMRVP